MVRYLNTANHNTGRNAKADKYFAKRLDFKDIKFLVKIRNIHKIEKKKKNFIDVSVFGCKNKEKYPIYVSKKFEEKDVDLLLIAEEKKITFLSKI